jgi:hypothetical protein
VWAGRATGGGDGAAAAGSGLAGRGGNGGFDVSNLPFVAPSFVLNNCVVAGNTGGAGGAGTGSVGGNGGGAAGPTQFTALGCTVAGNVAGTPMPLGQGTGGLAVGGSMVSSATLRNCIVWGNTRLGVPSDLQSIGIAAQVTSCDVGAVSGTTFGSGNLSADPLFANLAAGDVHLTASSPCRHAGTLVAGLPLFDVDGDPRVVGPGIDIGADEWDGLVGTREDLVLELTVDEVAQPAVVTSVAGANDAVAVRVRSPGGAFAADCTLLVADGWLPPVPPVPPAGLPGLHVSIGAFWLALYPTGVGAPGEVVGAVVPSGIGGFALRFQAIALSPAAQNGVYATTAARDLLLP